MTRMTRPNCAVMCNLINTHTHTHWKVTPQFLQILNRDEVRGLFVEMSRRNQPRDSFIVNTLLYILLPLGNPLNPMKSA